MRLERRWLRQERPERLERKTELADRQRARLEHRKKLERRLPPTECSKQVARSRQERQGRQERVLEPDKKLERRQVQLWPEERNKWPEECSKQVGRTERPLLVLEHSKKAEHNKQERNHRPAVRRLEPTLQERTWPDFQCKEEPAQSTAEPMVKRSCSAARETAPELLRSILEAGRL